VSWKNFVKTEQQLTSALATFDWAGTAKIVSELMDQIHGEGQPMPVEDAERTLKYLRRKSRFETMARLAEALIESGQRSAQVQRQYAQALIDLGYLYPAEKVLRSLAEEAHGTEEEDEARGLLGRAYKQMYVNGGKSSPKREVLESAIDAYAVPWGTNPKKNTWHGVNIAAVAARARRDEISWKGMPDEKALAKQILATLGAKPKGMDLWDLPTAMECYLALKDNRKVLEHAVEYASDPAADAFEIGSTLRQFEEVWGLTESKEPGKSVLPLLRAALIRRNGGAVKLTAVQANSDARPAIREKLEATFGTARFIQLKLYELGLERSKSVARIERPSGQGHGTGWLVDGGVFFRGWEREPLLVTNHHVISDYPGALRPSQARVNFQRLGKTVQVDQMLFTSDVDEFDISILTLKNKLPKAETLPLAEEPVEMSAPPPRLFVIGHPGGRDLEFSLEDNLLVGCDKQRLHYRSPTEGGSSGSPVFEDQEWKVVALHHAGGEGMQRLDGKKGVYQANEGIRLPVIQKKTRAMVPPKKK
jgi:hypothetical protein